MHLSYKRLLPLITVALSLLLVQAAQAAPVSQARGSFIHFVKDVYTGNPQACSYLDKNGRYEALKVGRTSWVLDHVTSNSNSRKLYAQASKIITTCAEGIVIYNKVFGNRKSILNSQVTQAQHSKAKEVNAHKVLFFDGGPPANIMIFEKGRWLLHSGFVIITL